MRVKSITLKNWGRHTELFADMDSPIVGLLGPNGSGKTTILKAIEFAFTGMLPDRLETYVQGYGSETGANNASVTLRFTKGGADGTIFRQVGKTNKRELDWDGQKFTKAAEVDKIMLDILEADKQALANAVFVSQGELDKILFGSQVERETLFAKLLLVSHLSKIADLFRKKGKIITEGLQDFTAVEDELRTQRVLAQEARHRAEQKFGQMQSFAQELTLLGDEAHATEQFNRANADIPVVQRSLTDAQQLLHALLVGKTEEEVTARYTELLQSKASVSDLQTKFEQAKAYVTGFEARQHTIYELEHKRAELKGKVKDSALLEAALAHAQQSHRGALAYAESLRKHEVALSAATAAQRDLDAFIARIESLETQQQRLDEARKALEDLAAKVAQQQMLSDLFTKAKECAHGTVCPLCEQGSFSGDDAGREAKLGLALSTISTERDMQASRVAQLDYQLTKEQREQAALQTAVQIAAINLKNAPPPPALVGDTMTPEVLQSMCEDLAARLATNKALIAELNTCEQQWAAKMAEPTSIELYEQHKCAMRLNPVDALNTQMTTIIAELAQIDELKVRMAPLTKSIAEFKAELDVLNKVRVAAEEDRKTAVAAFTEPLKKLLEGGMNAEQARAYFLTKNEEYQQAAGEVKATLAQVDEIVKRQAELSKRQEAEAAKRQMAADADRLASVFDRGGLPSAYIRYRFNQLVGLTQEHLNILDADFAVSLDPETPVSFRFVRTDDDSGYSMDQSKLSGGQRVRLTVAFLLAVQKLIIPEVGFLVLDEPTVHLDAPGVENLRNLLLGMAERLNNVDAQVLVCDHNPLLEQALGKTVRLKAA